MTTASMHSPINFHIHRHRHRLRLGFIRLLDAAPLIVARELGFFKDCGIDVSLTREVGWATIRDKMAFGELDASQALGPLAFSTTLGLGVPPTPCVAPMVLNTHGNAITLSRDLWKRGVRDAESLAREIKGTRSIKRYVFGVVSVYSSHAILLWTWLQSAGIKPGKDVQIVVLPPDQMVRCLGSGHLDGFCVGEPWNSLATRRKLGWCPATSADIANGHPEKVLLFSKAFVDKHTDESVAMMQALYRACIWCDENVNTEDLAELLSRREYLDCVPELVVNALYGRDLRENANDPTEERIIYFHKNNTNAPTREKATWLIEGMEQTGLIEEPAFLPSTLISDVFPDTLFREVQSIQEPTSTRQ